jgi:hypothetical protein
MRLASRLRRATPVSTPAGLLACQQLADLELALQNAVGPIRLRYAACALAAILRAAAPRRREPCSSVDSQNFSNRRLAAPALCLESRSGACLLIAARIPRPAKEVATAASPGRNGAIAAANPETAGPAQSGLITRSSCVARASRGSDNPPFRQPMSSLSTTVAGGCELLFNLPGGCLRRVHGRVPIRFVPTG